MRRPRTLLTFTPTVSASLVRSREEAWTAYANHLEKRAEAAEAALRESPLRGSAIKWKRRALEMGTWMALAVGNLRGFVNRPDRNHEAEIRSVLAALPQDWDES